MIYSLLATVLLSSVALTNAHICLLAPAAQRGGYNISTPGNDWCFQPQAPCGTRAAEDPTVSIQAGELTYIRATQDLNHYNVGNPGFLDVGIAKFPEPPSDDGFAVLRTVPDYWAHLQAQITNFSIPIVIPSDTPAGRYVLRVRYHPNKPTEPIFHQCADIMVSAAPSTSTSEGTVLSLTGAPPLTSKLYAQTLLDYSASGEVDRSASLVSTGSYLADGLAAYVEETDTAYYVGCTPPCDSAPAMTLVSVGDSIAFHNITDAAGNPIPGQLDAIVASGDPTNPLWMVGRVGNASNFFFYQVRAMSAKGVVSDVLATSAPQQTFVNFLWSAVVDTASKKLYFFAGDENSLYKLNAVVFTFDATTNALTCVTQDNSAYTFGSIHLVNGKLYAVSPGLFMSNHTWFLVTLDPTSGAVDQVGVIAEPGKFQFHYYGGLYGQPASSDGMLRYSFQSTSTDAFTVVTIDTSNGKIVAQHDIETGTNGELVPVTPMYVPATSRFSATPEVNSVL